MTYRFRQERQKLEQQGSSREQASQEALRRLGVDLSNPLYNGILANESSATDGGGGGGGSSMGTEIPDIWNNPRAPRNSRRLYALDSENLRDGDDVHNHLASMYDRGFRFGDSDHSKYSWD